MAGISYGDGATKRTIAAIFYGDGATKRTIQKAWIGDGGTNRLVYSAYSPITTVSISGTTSIAVPPSGGANTTLTASSNGSATSKSYAWSKISGMTNIAISGSTTSASVIIASSRANDQFTSDSAVFRCTVSDGNSSAYADVTVTFNGVL